MGAESSIEWTDATANFWRGCDKVSPGCAECYMFRDQRRYGRDPSIVTRCSDSTFYAPLRSSKWKRHAARIVEEEGRRLRVFTCSWSDFFHEDADEWRADAWDVIRQCPDYDWQILTKRPELIADRLPDDWGDGWPHVWLGVSIENHRFAPRVETLREIPAAVRFISAEPLLGPVFNTRWRCGCCGRADFTWPCEHCGGKDSRNFRLPGDPDPRANPSIALDEPTLDLTGIDWVITGGESGGRPGRALVERVGGVWVPKAEAVAWVSGIRDGCDANGIAFLHKQWGGPRPESGGRLLDGRTYDEFPESRAAVPA